MLVFSFIVYQIDCKNSNASYIEQIDKQFYTKI